MTILGSDDDDVGRVEPADTGELGRELTAAVCAGFRAYAQERAPAARLRAFEQQDGNWKLASLSFTKLLTPEQH